MKIQTKPIIVGCLFGGINFLLNMGFAFIDEENFHFWKFIFLSTFFGIFMGTFMGILAKYKKARRK